MPAEILPSADRNGARLLGRAVLVLLTLYALALDVPDFLRVVRPLGSFGLTANGDGLIYDVQGPFFSEEESPAWQAGIRRGERLDIERMRCAPPDTLVCASLLAQFGGVNYVMPGREGMFLVAASGERPAREVALVAKPRPINRLLDLVIALDTIAGILVVLGAAWLVWTRPGLMTWGFFAYVIQFNPGQAFQFWAWIQLWPRIALAQNAVFYVMQAAGYTGLLLFALRAPVDRSEGRWRRVERALPVVAVALGAVTLAGMGTVFGYPAEMWARLALIVGFAVSFAAVLILLGRRGDLSPRDYQRIRWVIWGCLIGLPAYLLAQLSQETSLFDELFGNGPTSEEAAGALYLVNGILCLFVVEAVRRRTVVNVWIPLRRATIFGLLLSVPVLFLHKQIETIDEFIHLPYWAWVAVASGLVYLIARAHEFTTELANRLFDRDFIRAERRLEEIGEAVLHARSLAEVERLLLNEPVQSLGLASAAVFREQDGVYRRRASAGWDVGDIDAFAPDDPILAGRFSRRPYRIDTTDAARGSHIQVPRDVARPLLAVPVGNPRRCYAVILYSGHEAGTDLDAGERRLLGALAHDAEVAYAQIECEALHSRVIALEGELAQVSAAR